MNGPEKPQRLETSLRGLARSLIEFISVRLELLSVEAREEAIRLGELVLYGAVAVVLLSLGLTFLAIFLTVLLWDSQRLLALAVFTTVFLTLGLVALFAARSRMAQGSRLLGASLDELKRDKERLNP